jgi:DNA-directed RNA polymerase alpha subunit
MVEFTHAEMHETYRKMYEMASRRISRLEQELRAERLKQIPVDDRIDFPLLATRVRNIFNRQMGVLAWSSVAAMSRSEILLLDGVGKVALEEIIEVLAERGLALRDMR